VLSGSVVEASRRTFGQASSEGLDRSSDVVHELGAATDQGLPGADQGHMGLGVFASVLEWVQQLRIETCQASQIFSVDLVGFTLALE
jgi:hypothetical protein